MASSPDASSSRSSPLPSPPGTSAQGANSSSPSKRSAPDRSGPAKKQKTTAWEPKDYYEHPVVGSTYKSAEKTQPPSRQDDIPGRQIYYVYTPNAPVDVDMVQRAITNLAEANFYSDLSLRHSVLNYLTTLVRMSPFLDARDSAIVQPLLDMWAIKRDEFEQCESLGDEEQFEAWQKENWLASRCASDDDARRAMYDLARREYIWGMEPAVRRGNQNQLLSGESLRQADEAALAGLLGMTEDPLPWSAWALRDTLEERLVAGARFIDTFSFSWVKGKTLAGEPALQNARKDAMRLLAEGGRLNEGVALLFLKAYAARSRKETEQETVADAAGKGKGRADAPAGDEHRSVEEDEQAFNMSDGDDAYVEPEEEEEGEATESESED